jgi:hypothetical protein
VDEVVGGIASTTILAVCISHSYLDRSCSSEQNAIAAGYHLTGYVTIDRHLFGFDTLHRHTLALLGTRYLLLAVESAAYYLSTSQAMDQRCL